MLAVQQHLRSGNTLESLTEELGINVYRHPELPLVGMKYSQINSPKTHPIVRDCRGIVLEYGTWNVVAKPFRRFFNAGEDQENFERFDWSDFTVTTKEDGSLILLYHYRGEWHVNTSGSFGLGECGFSGKTWRDLFWETAKLDRTMLDEECTYIFELCTPYNRVIRSYPAPVAFLLSVFRTPTLEEASVSHADRIASVLGVPRPEHHHFGSMDEITGYLREMETRDRTYEGVVVRDSRDERFKVKTQTYLALHHLVDNGNLYNPKRLVPLILAGETDEVVAYLPDVKPHLDRVAEAMDREYAALASLWRRCWPIESQKDFALSVVKQTPFSGLLFQLRKELGANQTETALRDKWRGSAELITKVLFN